MIYWRLASLPPVLHPFTIFKVGNMICFVALILHDFSCHSWYCGSVVTDHKFYLETISRATCFMLSFIWDIITFSKKNTKTYWSIYLKGNRWLSISETCTVTIINIQRKLSVRIIRGDLRNICNSDISVCYYFCSSVSWFGNPLGHNAFVYSFGSPKNV